MFCRSSTKVELVDLASSTNIYSHFLANISNPSRHSASLIMIESLFGGHSLPRVPPPGWLHPTLTVSILQTLEDKTNWSGDLHFIDCAPAGFHQTWFRSYNTRSVSVPSWIYWGSVAGCIPLGCVVCTAGSPMGRPSRHSHARKGLLEAIGIT